MKSVNAFLDIYTSEPVPVAFGVASHNNEPLMKSYCPDDAFINKEASHHALILTSSIAELEAWWDYLLDQPRKAKLKDFLNVRANKARTLPYNQQSGLRMTA